MFDPSGSLGSTDVIVGRKAPFGDTTLNWNCPELIGPGLIISTLQSCAAVVNVGLMIISVVLK